MAGKVAVLMYDMNNNLLKRYNSLNEASVDTGIKVPTIWSQCNNNIKSRGDVYFRYEGSKKETRKYKYKNRKKIVELTLSGEFVKIWDTQADISRDKKVHQSTICRILSGAFKSKDFKLMYLDDYENLYGKIEAQEEKSEEVSKPVKKEIIKRKTKECFVNVLVGLANGTLIDGATYEMNGTVLTYSKSENSLKLGENNVYTQKEMFGECAVELPILLPKEKEFLSSLLKAFNNVTGIVKCKDRIEGFEFIRIETSNVENNVSLPSFLEGKYYTSLTTDVLYSLEDLGL